MAVKYVIIVSCLQAFWEDTRLSNVKVPDRQKYNRLNKTDESWLTFAPGITTPVAGGLLSSSFNGESNLCIRAF